MKNLNQCIDIPPTLIPFIVISESSNQCGHVPGNGIGDCGG
ncbi:hypothetical protein BT246_70830 (plasmid) [Bacillus thuringiensis]|uniref:Uncharacterized protein n=1 Tax=Bacillus thuringiensis TaxID=1428 RepID=A0A9W3SJ24_BACTU|nr:hypothetical protein BT246_65470 [Bacillus thuringiensis]ANS52373.1 hypothetical protein BT246_70830 [Bacillus thuringiensis]